MLEKILKYKTSLIHRVTQSKKNIPQKWRISNHVVEGTEEEIQRILEEWGRNRQTNDLDLLGWMTIA
jgi:hypothetical protein